MSINGPFIRRLIGKHTSATDSHKRRLYPHHTLAELLRRRRHIILNPHILLSIVPRSTHLACSIARRNTRLEIRLQHHRLSRLQLGTAGGQSSE